MGAGHPFREGGHIPELPAEQLRRFDFLDHERRTLPRTRKAPGGRQEPWRGSSAFHGGGSDTHQAVQYGCIRTGFEKEVRTVYDLYEEMKAGRYEISVSDYAAFQVKTAGLLKKGP